MKRVESLIIIHQTSRDSLVIIDYGIRVHNFKSLIGERNLELNLFLFAVKRENSHHLIRFHLKLICQPIQHIKFTRYYWLITCILLSRVFFPVTFANNSLKVLSLRATERIPGRVMHPIFDFLVPTAMNQSAFTLKNMATTNNE